MVLRSQTSGVSGVNNLSNKPQTFNLMMCLAMTIYLNPRQQITLRRIRTGTAYFGVDPARSRLLSGLQALRRICAVRRPHVGARL